MHDVVLHHQREPMVYHMGLYVKLAKFGDGINEDENGKRWGKCKMYVHRNGMATTNDRQTGQNERNRTSDYVKCEKDINVHTMCTMEI